MHGVVASSWAWVHGYGHSPLWMGVGLSLSLGLRPMKTHSSNQEMRSNKCVLGEARKGVINPLR